MIVVPPENTKQKFWSGGSTRELFIFPRDTVYEKRNFDFRLSIATIETSPSIFTPLPGYLRNTLILDGMLKLAHEGHRQRTLNKFGVDEYDGAWITRSEGKSTNLNLMTTPSFRGSMKGITLIKGTAKLIPCTSSFTFLYIHQGVIRLSTQDQPFLCGTLLGMETGNTIQIEAEEDCELAIVSVSQVYAP